MHTIVYKCNQEEEKEKEEEKEEDTHYVRYACAREKGKRLLPKSNSLDERVFLFCHLRCQYRRQQGSQSGVLLGRYRAVFGGKQYDGADAVAL